MDRCKWTGEILYGKDPKMTTQYKHFEVTEDWDKYRDDCDRSTEDKLTENEGQVSEYAYDNWRTKDFEQDGEKWSNDGSKGPEDGDTGLAKLKNEIRNKTNVNAMII